MICPACGQENRESARFCDGCAASLATSSSDQVATPAFDGFAPSEGFVGRQQELGELKTALDDALSGRGRVVMLAGEPGIGKTRTAQELASHAETLGAQVLWGRCFEEEGAPPYWPWVQPIRSYIQQQSQSQLQMEMGPGAADIAEIVPELREKLPDLETPPSLEPEQARFRIFSSITTFFKNAAQSQSLMLVLDDLHWADKPSLLLLQFLAREMGGSRLLVVGTYRDVELSRQHPLSETLAQLSREPVFRRELLRGLSRQDTGDFVEVAAGLRPPPELVESIYLQTEGNPFFMGEVIRLLAEQGELREGGIGESPGIRIPEGVREVVGQRLNRLSGQCNRTLITGAVIGREFDFRLLMALSDGISEGQLLEAIDEGLEARLIEELTGGLEQYQFSHVLIQETLSEELSTSRKVRLHGRIAEALEKIYGANVEAHAAELAYHFAEAETVLGTEKLVQYSLLAGERALATYAHEEALRHFQRALAAKEGQPPDAEAADLWFGLGRAQAATLERRQLEEAIASLSRAFDYYDGVGDVDRAVAIAEQPSAVFGRSTRAAAQLTSRALALVPSDSHQAGRLLSRLGEVMSREEGEYDGAQKLFSQAMAIARREGDVALEMRTLAESARSDYVHLRYPESLEKGLRAVELARQVDEPYTEGSARFSVGRVSMVVGDLGGVSFHGAAMLELAERLRDRSLLGSALWLNERKCYLEGNWEAARAFNDRGQAVLSKDPRLLGTRVQIEYHVGEFQQGDVYLERLLGVMNLTSPGPTLNYGFPAMVIPLVARITGVPNRLDVAEAAADSVLTAPSANPFIASFARLGLGLLATLRGDVVAASEQYSALESLRGTMLPMPMLMAADHVLGILKVTTGELDQAMAHFEDALAFCRQAGYRPELAWTCHDYADTLFRRNQAGDRVRAMSLLEESLAISTELGMRPLTERVVALQERAESQLEAAPAYPDGLTQREVEVLRLVAAGKTDREIAEELIISIRTVSNHVSSILNRTDAANRAEAATYASRHGLA